MVVTLPPPVGPGDRVGIAALSGTVEPRRLARGLEALKALGFEPVRASNLGSVYGPMAGPDPERLESFHQLVADESVKAIIFARGGYGATRLLPHIDWELLARRPKAYVGYSDLTPLLNLIPTRLGFATFHGPMVAAELAGGLSPDERERFVAGLAGQASLPIPIPGWLRAGAAEGPLLGGCLSVLAAVIGTEWMPDLAGSLLLLEDVGEPPYRIDRMLTHMRLSGNLTQINGTVLGHFGEGGREGVDEWHRETVLGLPGPVATGVSCGHGRPNLMVPLGLPAVCDPGGWLRIG